MADVRSHESQFNSLTCTAQNLLIDMESKQCEVVEFSNELAELKSYWSDINTIVCNLTTKLQQECTDLNTYLGKLGDFSERLNSVYAEFYDELCTAIPPNASQETINRQKQILEVQCKCTNVDYVCCSISFISPWSQIFVNHQNSLRKLTSGAFTRGVP